MWRCAGPTPPTTPASGRWPSSAELAGRDLSDLDLHRPYVDEVTFPCPVEGCGATATRLEPVLDAWFDSGSMPAAQFHHPFARATTSSTRRFPADFICEAIDQTRGWFYSLLAVNTLVFGQTPYRNVVCLAHVVDQDGAKMSKSKGNVIDPWEIFRTKGADPLRWYFFSAGSPWTNRRVYGEGIDESIRKFLLTLWNTLSFFVTYANLERLRAGRRPRAAAPEHVLDRWIGSRREATVAAVTDALEDYDTLAAAQTLETFVDDLSNWYVRRSRPRFWKASDPGAFAALYESLSTVAKLLAPFCPVRGRRDPPGPRPMPARRRSTSRTGRRPTRSLIDAGLEAEMALARRLVALGRAARGEARMKVRQPLRRALLLGARRRSGSPPRWPPRCRRSSTSRSLEVVESLAGLIRYSVVPNFRALGPRLGPKLPAVKAALASADGAEVSRSLEETGSYTLDDRRGADRARRRRPRGPGRGARGVRPRPGRARTPWPSTSRSTTTCGSRVWPGNWPGRSTTTARPAAWPSPTGSRCASGPTGPVAEAAERHGAWIAGEVLAVDWQVNPDEHARTAPILDVEGTAGDGRLRSREPVHLGASAAFRAPSIRVRTPARFLWRFS